MLLNRLAAIRETMSIAGLDRLAEHLPLAWIEEALPCAGCASVQLRRLSAEQVVWLVIDWRSIGTSRSRRCWPPWTWRCRVKTVRS